MSPTVKKTIRSRWFAGCVHAGMWLLLYLAVTHLGGKVPDVREANAVGARVQSPVPVDGLERLFSSGIWPAALDSTNNVNPFATRHFIPPPSPAPPPPTTRTIEVTYQGFYQIGDGTKHTMYKVGDVLQVAPLGTELATSLFIADANIQALTLTNLAAQTNILPLNTKKPLVVPIK